MQPLKLGKENTYNRIHDNHFQKTTYSLLSDNAVPLQYQNIAKP